MKVLPLTAEVWTEGLMPGRDWQEDRDAPRIRRAFLILIATATQWPSLARFIEVLPLPDAPRIGHEDKPADPAWLRRELENFRNGVSADENTD